MAPLKPRAYPVTSSEPFNGLDRHHADVARLNERIRLAEAELTPDQLPFPKPSTAILFDRNLDVLGPYSRAGSAEKLEANTPGELEACSYRSWSEDATPERTSPFDAWTSYREDDDRPAVQRRLVVDDEHAGGIDLLDRAPTSAKTTMIGAAHTYAVAAREPFFHPPDARTVICSNTESPWGCLDWGLCWLHGLIKGMAEHLQRQRLSGMQFAEVTPYVHTTPYLVRMHESSPRFA
eukprot:CAMPEP_0181217858 /NCGR_PEP_ID=MMETSP1096-20121128/27376_1 /TAXON_ID=156174 ORGANISM="Chrysochromulina ericina, Strain CCMP281" /NCGR_SAMPLE_ID=MMETSP1096 /ASSEMBLY_ACC=CAM_ASM_000453 /LENGTH=235 /DNA_ID=CAMNT_0023310019 /DNA_START=47 /DNA_END=754 /DNA_ORIENTATION=+